MRGLVLDLTRQGSFVMQVRGVGSLREGSPTAVPDYKTWGDFVVLAVSWFP